MDSTLKIMREAIGQRCRQIVTVFNGHFDLEVEPGAVLKGQVSGWNAPLHSVTAPLFSPHVSNALRLISPEPNSNWLELSDPNDEDDMRLTFESANLLVWHELCHLADPQAIDDILRNVLLPDDSNGQILAHAREVVIDGLAFEMGRWLYVHQPKGQFIPGLPTERAKLMYRSLASFSRRICRVGYPLTLDQKLIIVRLWGELQTHALDGSALANQALFQLEQVRGLVLKEYVDLKNTYAVLYGCALSLANANVIAFRQSLDEWESETGKNHYAVHVYH